MGKVERMITVESKCVCGSIFKESDSRGSYINDGGRRDNKGRKFLIELRLDQWLEKHKGCVEVWRARQSVETLQGQKPGKETEHGEARGNGRSGEA